MSPKIKRKVSKGTGRRFESHRPKLRAEPVRRVHPPEPSRAEKSLRKAIMDFSSQERFKQDFDGAARQYFGEEATRDRRLTVDEGELPGFMEWYFFDYRLQTGERIIDQFAREIGPKLNSVQRAILDDWLVWNRARLLEFQEVKPGIGVVVQDLLSEEVFEVNDISSSYSAVRWTIALIRPILTEGRVSFTGSAVVLPPTEKAGVLKFAQDQWARYQSAHPQASLPDFYRDHSLDLHLAMQRATEEAAKPPAILTAEGHPAVVSRARYEIRGDPHAVEAALDASQEFVYAGPSEEHKGARHYNWLMVGRSHVPEATEKPKRALQLSTQFFEKPGGPHHLNLGDLSLGSKLMELECMSRERLAAGKALLEAILGSHIKHRRDTFEKLDFPSRDEGRPAARRPKPAQPVRNRETFRMLKEMSEQHTKQWLDDSIPALDGLTPRQAVKTPQGRKKVLDLIKVIEYHMSRREDDGTPPPMNVARIRKELGL